MAAAPPRSCHPLALHMVHIYSTAVAQHPLTWKSKVKGQGHTVSEVSCMLRPLRYCCRRVSARRMTAVLIGLLFTLALEGLVCNIIHGMHQAHCNSEDFR